MSSSSIIAVDIDCKNGKNGFETLAKLKSQGLSLIPTFTQLTPSGGKHLLYLADIPVSSRTNSLGSGLDIKSRGGYVVAAGSAIEGTMYTQELGSPDKPAKAPHSLIGACTKPPKRKSNPIKTFALCELDLPPNINYAISFLQITPVAIESHGGDAHTYLTACRVKDFGISQKLCLQLMDQVWNHRCQPPWSYEDLRTKVRNAYLYGTEEIGACTKEAFFRDLE